jgi:DNA-binding transcriptional LysR family regulator
MPKVESEDLSFFRTVASSSSLADAARLLGVSPAAVTQRLQHIEARLGTRLINRSSRRLVLTDDGTLVLSRARVLLAGLNDLHDELDARRGLLSGVLHVLAPIGFGRAYVAPAITALSAAHSALRLELLLSDRVGRLTEDTWDVAIHIGALQETTLYRQVLAPNERWLCVAPSYLRHNEPPESILDLKRHACIVVRENDEDVTFWRFARNGETFAIRIEPTLATNDGDVAKTWCLEGAGIVLRSEWHVAADVAAGRLVRLLADFRAPDADIVALMPQRQGSSLRLEAFVNQMRVALRPPPWRSMAPEAKHSASSG